MKKRILSLFLAIAMVLGTVTATAQDVTQSVTVYFSLGCYGEIVKDKDGNDMVYTPVTLYGKQQYNLNDVFLSVHKNYYPDGTDGYASSEGEYGFGIDMLWGDTSYNFGYQVNGGEESVMGLGHIVKDGDHIEAAIYKNLYPDTESYAKFQNAENVANTGKPLTLTLLYVSGYDENWQSIFSPCQDATIIINGEETEYITDDSGEVSIIFDTPGEYVVSAEKQKQVNEQMRPAITAPVCKVLVKEHEAIEIMHNIAGSYSDMDLEQTGGNLPWIVADMITYEQLYPESDNVFSDNQKQHALELIVDGAHNAKTAGDLSKYIIALRALGYDAKQIYTKDFIKDDVVQKLLQMVEDKREGVTNIYTLPYVMIALSQSPEYAAKEQIDYLIQSAVESKEQWQNTEFGTDALTPMLVALAPYYNTNDDVKSAIDESVDILKSNQRQDGLIDGFEGYESASTGLAICGLSALGINSENVKNPDLSLIDGLLQTVNENKDGFPNAFATEQGFRGLLSWQIINNNTQKSIYDFSDNPMEEVNIPGVQFCPVIFEVLPETASVTSDDLKQVSDYCFDAPQGTHIFNISASGFISQTYTVEITAEQAESRTPETIEISLAKRASGGGSGGGSVIIRNDTEKEQQNKPQQEIQNDTQQPDIDTTKPVFDRNTFKDVKQTDWYFDAVKYVYQNNLFKGTDNGFEPNLPVTRAMLVTVLHRLDNIPVTKENNSFTDVKEDTWYYQSVNWAHQNGIVNGISENEFAPDNKITREQVATILFRYASYKGYNTQTQSISNELNDYTKVSSYAKDAVDYMISKGIMSGRDNNNLAPCDTITRAETAMVIMRFAEVVNNEQK